MAGNEIQEFDSKTKPQPLDIDVRKLWGESTSSAAQPSSFAHEVLRDFDSQFAGSMWKTSPFMGSTGAAIGTILGEAHVTGFIKNVSLIRSMGGGLAIAVGTDLASTALQKAVGDTFGSGVEDFLGPTKTEQLAAGGAYGALMFSAMPWYAKAGVIGAAWLGGKVLAHSPEYLSKTIGRPTFGWTRD